MIKHGENNNNNNNTYYVNCEAHANTEHTLWGSCQMMTMAIATIEMSNEKTIHKAI